MTSSHLATHKKKPSLSSYERFRHYGPPWHKSGWLNMLYFTMLLVSWKLTYHSCQTQCGGWYIWHMGVSTAQQCYNMLRWHICHTSALGAKRRTSEWVQHIKQCRDRDIRCTLYGGLAGPELGNRTSLTRDDPIFFSTLTWSWRWQAILFHLRHYSHYFWVHVVSLNIQFLSLALRVWKVDLLPCLFTFPRGIQWQRTTHFDNLNGKYCIKKQHLSCSCDFFLFFAIRRL